MRQLAIGDRVYSAQTGARGTVFALRDDGLIGVNWDVGTSGHSDRDDLSYLDPQYR